MMEDNDDCQSHWHVLSETSDTGVDAGRGPDFRGAEGSRSWHLLSPGVVVDRLRSRAGGAAPRVAGGIECPSLDTAGRPRLPWGRDNARAGRPRTRR